MRGGLVADDPTTRELQWQITELRGDISDVRTDISDVRASVTNLRKELREDFREIIAAREELQAERLRGFDARLGRIERGETDRRNARLMGIGAVVAAVIGSVVLAYMSARGH